MNIYITKYKAHPNGILNYFSVPSVQYVDHLIINEHQILEDAFSDYTDELQELDNPFSFTTGGYDLRLSLLKPSVSAAGKSMTAFFDPATDNYLPVGFKIAIGESLSNIDRGDFIDYESIKTNWRKDDNGWILSFSVIGAEEEYIKRAEMLQAQEVTSGINYRSYLTDLLNNTQVFSNVSVINGTSARFLLNGFTPFQPVISFPIHNAVLNSYNDKSRWRVFLNWCKDMAWAYRVEHSSSCNPAQLDTFNFRVFYPTDALGTITAPKIVEDEDYIISNTLEYSTPDLAMYFVSYTSPQLPSQDMLGSLYMNKNETTIGYINMDGGGLVAGNLTNNFFKNYNLGDWVIRNNKAYNEKYMLLPASERGFFGTSGGVNLGASIGRSLVKTFDYRNIAPPPSPPVYSYFGDTGFPAVLNVGPVREYRHHVSGASQQLEYTGTFENLSDMKIYKKFQLDGKNWLIKQLKGKKLLNDNTCIIKAVRI